MPNSTPFDPEQVEGWGQEMADEDWKKAFDETMALDPALQIGGEEEVDMPQKVKDRLKLIPEDVKFEVRRAHHTLGHPSRNTLLRLAKAAGKSEQVLDYIRHWNCPVCQRRARPAAVQTANPRARVQEFNALVGVDLKEVLDVNGERHTYLNILDVATRFSMFVRVSSKDSDEVATSFMTNWVTWAGIPTRIIHDQGGEFFGCFTEMMRTNGIIPHVIATEAPW